MTAQDLSILQDLIARARRAGADHADAVLLRGIGLSQAQRLGKLEKLERAEGQDLGLRVMIGQRQAVVSSNDLSAVALSELTERAIAMAKAVPEDRFCGLADPTQIAMSWPDLDSEDADEPSAEKLIELARACEDAARSYPGITNSEGAEASWSRHQIALAASNGFAGSYAATGAGLSVSVIAGEGADMQSDYDYSRAVFMADLEDATLIGRRAAERATKRLYPKKPPTAPFPVIFDRRVSSSLIGHLASAINGQSIARGTSFLKDQLGKEIATPNITIWDEPHRPRGHRSKPFDGEGLPGQKRAIVDQGRLTCWILDLATARQLGMTSTGHASRGTSSPPSPSVTNFWLAPGEKSPDQLIGEIDQGFLITELMGMGVNGVTGDYSRGAGGFWIEKGQITHPVSEATIAGNLKELFRQMTPANDLQFRSGIDAPSIRIEAMTVAGK